MPSSTLLFVQPPGRRRFSLAQSDSLLTRMRSVASDELNQMMQRRMSQENPIRASETEFVQRLQRLVVLAVNRLIYHGKHWEWEYSSAVAVMYSAMLMPRWPRALVPQNTLSCSSFLVADVSEDFYDLLNIPDSPDQTSGYQLTPDPGEQAQDEGSSGSTPAAHSPIPFPLPPASKKSFQKDILKLMMEGIKISLVGFVFLLVVTILL